MVEPLEITLLDGGTGLRLAGDLDLHSVPTLIEAFASVRIRGQATVDVSELTFIDSSGLHAILKLASSENGGGPLILEGVSARMLRLLEITNLATHPNLDIQLADGR